MLLTAWPICVFGKICHEVPLFAVCSGATTGQTTPRASSFARAVASQCFDTSGAGVPSGSSSISRRATIGPPSDSFYEYCWDGWQLLGDPGCKTMYDTLTAAILAHQAVRHGGALWFVDVDFETGARLSTEQDELASFYGGLLAQGGAVAEGAAYTRAWATVQDRFGILPEGYDYATGQPTARTNSLRPELADAAFNLWLLDRSDEWRRIGRAHYLAMKRWNKARFGYTDMADVVTKRQADHCPGYWWSEQMKYYYLMFADCPRFDYRDNYLSTEGNVLKGLLGPD